MTSPARGGSGHAGGGLPVVWVPGHLCGPWLYASQIAAFSAAHPAILADILSDDDLGAMAERLLAAAPPRFVIAGLSMGGMVAMEAMARAPSRIAGAALIATDPTEARPREREWRGSLIAACRSKGLAHYVDRFVPKFFAHDAGVDAALGPLVSAMTLETPMPVARAQARALDRRRAMAPLVSGFPGPVEVIVGAEDRICPPLLHRPLAAALPQAALTELPGVGHLATLEAPEAVNARLDVLFRRIGG